MIEKILLNNALNEWPDSNSISKLVGLNNGEGGNITPGNILSNQQIAKDSFLVGYGGMSYAAIKSLGRKGGDGEKSVLLVSRYNSNQRNDFCGMLGRMFALRGHAAAGLAVYMCDVVCVTAYNVFKFSHSDASMRCGKCTSNLEIPPILISFSRDFIQVIAYSLTFLNQKSHGSIDWLGVIPALLLETDIESELTITLILYDKFHFPLFIYIYLSGGIFYC